MEDVLWLLNVAPVPRGQTHLHLSQVLGLNFQLASEITRHRELMGPNGVSCFDVRLMLPPLFTVTTLFVTGYE